MTNAYRPVYDWWWVPRLGLGTKKDLLCLSKLYGHQYTKYDVKKVKKIKKSEFLKWYTKKYFIELL